MKKKKFVTGGTLRPGDVIITRDFGYGVTILAYNRLKNGEAFYDVSGSAGYYFDVPYEVDRKILVERV